jgi:hypothetical protein
MGSAVFRSDHSAGPKIAGRDAALFITKLPKTERKTEQKAEHDADEGQALCLTMTPDQPPQD